MKKIILTALIILSGALLYAQKNPSSFEVSVNGGIASPSGNFGKGDYANEKSGYAKTGYNLNVTGTYFIHNGFGIGAFVGYSQFGFKGSQSLADGYKEDSGTDSTTLYSKGHNQSFSVLAGPYYSIPAGKKVSIDLRALAGYVNTRLAGFQVFYEDYLDNSMSQNESSAGAFGFQVGAAFKYKITNKIAVKLNADYFSSTPKINITYENFVVNSGRRLTQYNEAINGVNATVGIAFNLSK
ncbi:MAG: outer membrane beta-barrel protein [Ginsengibacter sp.]